MRLREVALDLGDQLVFVLAVHDEAIQLAPEDLVHNFSFAVGCSRWSRRWLSRTFRRSFDARRRFSRRATTAPGSAPGRRRPKRESRERSCAAVRARYEPA